MRWELLTCSNIIIVFDSKIGEVFLKDGAEQFGQNILTVGLSAGWVSLFCHIVNMRQGRDKVETIRDHRGDIIIPSQGGGAPHYQCQLSLHSHPATDSLKLVVKYFSISEGDTRKCVVRRNIAFPPQFLPLLKWNVVILSKINLCSVSGDII